MELKSFEKQQKVDLLLDAQHRNDVTSGQKQMKKNRVILRRFVGTLYPSAKQELPVRGYIFKHKNSWNF
jgi:hypothetical protein